MVQLQSQCLSWLCSELLMHSIEMIEEALFLNTKYNDFFDLRYVLNIAIFTKQDSVDMLGLCGGFTGRVLQ